ncbi:MAG: hypothetical protein SF029_26420 [bacterium]|nr:hypothetical protein [bacterium]
MVNPANVAFGVPAAERDAGLIHYFVENEAFRRIKSGEKFIILGNRGSGKTAIIRMIEEYEKQQGHVVINVSPDDYSYELFSQNMLAQDKGSWVKQSAYAAAWRYVLFILAMKELNSTSKSPVKLGSANKIYSYLRDNHKMDNLNPIGMLISYLKRLENLKVGSFEVNTKVKELDKLYKLEEIQELIEPLKEVGSKRPIIVLIDELDRGWDSSEDAQAFVAGLFEASLRINLQMRGAMRVILSLRRELYDSIPSIYSDSQKYTDVIEIIEWDEQSLLQLISLRILASFPETRDLDHRSRWNTTFPETLEYRQTKSFNYIVDRTLYRPREIIQFCSTIQKVAADKGKPKFDYETISIAESDYSQQRLKDIANEYKFQYPGLGSIFETFRGMTYTLDRDELETHCLRIILQYLPVEPEAKVWCVECDPNKMIQILWDVGFIQAFLVGKLKANQRAGSRYLGVYQNSSLPLININKFQIHPMFRSYLGTKEKKVQQQ